ncbi:MAG: CvpA family protein [Gammaproteobacteria bacterium]|nr:CvpA family protein [Gammaproteobacteria bacterium]
MPATIDIAVVIIVLVSALIGMGRGVIKEVVSLTIWLAAFIFGLAFAVIVGEMLVDFILAENVRVALGFVLVFVTVLIAGSMVQWLLAKAVKSTGLTGTDRFMGFLFGSIRGTIVTIVALIALRPFAEMQPWWAESTLLPELLAFEADIVDVIRFAGGSLSDMEELTIVVEKVEQI